MPAKMPIRVVLAAFLAAGSLAFMAEAQSRIGLQPASVELEMDKAMFRSYCLTHEIFL